MLATRLLGRATARVSCVVGRAEASNRPAIFLPSSAAASTTTSDKQRQKQSLVLQKDDDGDTIDPMEGPSGLKREDLMAQLRQLYFEEDERTAALRSQDGSGREYGAPVFRQIVYNEGELDASDLTKPPSKWNPHPFDTSTLPPSHARSLVPYVNHVRLLQVLVDLGVDLFEIETKYPSISRHLLRLKYADARTKIRWLVSIGFTPDALGEYITRNPYVLLQNLDDMKARINYLASIKFTQREIYKLVSEFRFWLNIDVKTTESRLETVRGMFGLRKSILRQLLVKEPRLLMFGLGPIKRIWDLLTNEFRLSPEQVKEMLIADPRLFMMDSRVLIANFVYATRVMNVPIELITAHPLLLRVAHSSLRCRHEFLRALGRARYSDQQKAGGKNDQIIISIPDLLLPSDAEFAEKVARVTPASYDIYQRSH